ncbi:hypothetical protein NUW54_g9655 [Trametes sanguinea]|uniref:Uncharacterized protein n=1 Tax=Trametes sanguinea TaxID=158606 RepID=A0ACC1P4C7_9APHY|nr:hypothetical protein NUW54_g9655 [Trametes sanguinea]
MGHPALDKYRLPRDQVDVEALTQRWFYYLWIDAEDTEILSHDPTRRDAIITQLYSNPEVKPSCWPQDIVGDMLPAEKYDEYLAQADAAIVQLTPPRSLEDRVVRCHLATAALMVFMRYKCTYALDDHYDLKLKVSDRSAKLFRDWMLNEFPRYRAQRPGSAGVNQTTRPSPALEASLSSLQACRSDNAKEGLSPEVASYLDSPHTLLGKRFQHSPPAEEEQDLKGIWELVSYTARMEQGCIDHEFVIATEALDGAHLPMDGKRLSCS